MEILLSPQLHSSSEFSNVSFWQRFFDERQQLTFEWYLDPHDIAPFLSIIPSGSSCLHIGTGNSELPLFCYDNLNHHQTICIDFSPNVIDEMKNKSKTRPGLQFLCMNALHLSFPDSTFELSIDKGLFDAMISEDSKEKIQHSFQYFQEIKRTLKSSGCFILISLLQPYILSILFEITWKQSWNVQINPIFPKKIDSEKCPFLLLWKKCDAHPEINLNGVSYTNLVSLQNSIFDITHQYQQTYLEQNQKLESQLVTLELKPIDSDADLNHIWQIIQKEFPFHWRYSHCIIEPMCFGLHKLSLQCIIGQDIDISDLSEILSNHHSLSELISSVDIIEALPLIS